MISDEKYNKLVEVLNRCDRKFLLSEGGRRRMGHKLALTIDMFPGRVYDFLDEMVGLDLYLNEDWVLFLQFLKYSL
jgi:hypothetical protein